MEAALGAVPCLEDRQLSCGVPVLQTPITGNICVGFIVAGTMHFKEHPLL